MFLLLFSVENLFASCSVLIRQEEAEATEEVHRAVGLDGGGRAGDDL
jgi:hypothetical protein